MFNSEGHAEAPVGEEKEDVKECPTPRGPGLGRREKVCGEAEGQVQSWETRSQHWAPRGSHSRLDTASLQTAPPVHPLQEPRALPDCWGRCWSNTPRASEVAVMGKPTGFCP